MRTSFIFYLSFVFTFSAFSQEKRDYNWPLGYGPSNDPVLHYGGSLIQFHSGQPMVSFYNIPFAYSGDNANISDKHGNLVAYTNGCQIQNSEHSLMENGDDINPGIVHQQQCSAVSGYSFDQGSLFLPWPGSDSLYYLFHLKFLDAGSITFHLLYSTLDASENNGLGKVLLKNQFLDQDTFSGMVTAVRHANGRDWWLLVQENYRNLNVPTQAKGIYHRYLIDPMGIHGPVEQRIGRLWTAFSSIGQASFSPDGRHYAIGNVYNGVNLFDFNRCTGMLSNPLHLPFSADTCWAMGVAFSPNSRFLYVTTGGTITQFDVQAPGVAGSKKVVAVYDGFAAPYPTSFYQLRLGPDGKIYGSCPNGVDLMHIIHAPDETGKACQVEQHGLQLPTYHAYTVPNLAWFGLYDEPGTVCDSLGINGPVAVAELGDTAPLFACFPNPACNSLSIQFALSEPGHITITDAAGQTRAQWDKPAGQSRIEFDITFLPAGVYFISYLPVSGQASTQKVVVLR